MEEYDIAIIGGGPGGYVAAIRASQNGKKVVLFEEKHLGGICLNWGCIPTKALLKSAEILEYAKHAVDYGVKISNATPDLEAMVKRSRKISEKLCQGIKSLLTKHKVSIINMRATLESNSIVSTKDTQYKVKNIIIATGARARILKGFEPDHKIVWSYMDALVQNNIPSSLIIVGSGAIGLEFASFYNSLGSKVTVLESASRILFHEDEEISAHAKKLFENQGISFKCGVSLIDLIKSREDVTIKYKVNNITNQIKGSNLLMAVGVVGNTENLGIENTKIIVKDNNIIVDKYLRTAEKNIYAIGDIVEGPWLAHKASHEAIIATDHASGIDTHIIDRLNIPRCIYSNPQIASIGLTEQQVCDKGIKYNVGKFPFHANGKALAIGKSEGMVKVIYDANIGRILGAHIIGDNVTELISNFALGKSSELTDLDFINNIFPHPTLSEILHEASLDSIKRTIHI